MANLIITIFFGWSGYARFRKGQAGLGVLWLFTGGCFAVGWIIDIVDAVKEMNGSNTPKTNESSVDYDVVFVNKGSKVYHCDQSCAMSHTARCEEMKEKQAIKQGLKRCKKCYGDSNV